ncbi:MAG: deoxyribodipyrimidine photo-lyase [Solirubrobacterales bacterium]|nr:deoxyribodipyrimidine photo-lyase [Solirubrobacterales bacterium]
MSTLVWYRRDLRVHDHPALRAARDAGEPVIPVFCFDDGLLGGRHASGPRTQFMLECLRDLDDALRRRGSRLFVRRGDPARELAELAREVDATALHFSVDVGPFARRRQSEVKDALQEIGVEVMPHPGLFAIDALEPIRAGSGKPYTVFTPFYRNWLRQPRRDVLGAPGSLPDPGRTAAAGTLPSLTSLGLRQEVDDPARGGETVGRKALSRFLGGPIEKYAEEHNTLSGRAVSRLSPYLHFGCVSPREIEERLERTPSADAWRRQVCWRDFYAHVLGHHPRNARSEFQERYRGMQWSRSEKNFEAWCEGRTGFPVVDAGMRQLRREGWMHNRARLVVGSFLTKDLAIDWRWGERWFMRLLLDGDEASNNGNWQWIASVGVDPAPAFRRMFNPSRQQHRFDPDGEYVRHYVPELAEVPDDFLAEPWRMPDDVQQECGCRVGTDYPEPIVEHAEARRRALERYRVDG